jgi:hypothetical protein
MVLVVIAVSSVLAAIPYVSTYALWIAVIGYVVLVIGCAVRTA